MTNALALNNDWFVNIDTITQSVDSLHSKRAYSRALLAFLDWYERGNQPGFSKATVTAYCEHLLAKGRSRSSVNQAGRRAFGRVETLLHPPVAAGNRRSRRCF